MTKYLTFIFTLCSLLAIGQPNCNVYKLDGNQRCYEACLLATEAEKYQGTRQSQLQFDNAIELCPGFSYSYAEKAVPYLKRGDFVTWKQLIDKAVTLDPHTYLGYRAWCRFQFLRDYRGALQDFATLDSISPSSARFSQNGDYHLNVVKALCYKGIGQKQTAIIIIEKQLTDQGYSPMPYDYLHLGVLKLEVGDLQGAIDALKKQLTHDDFLAETYYYLGMVFKQLQQHSQYQENMAKAKDFFLRGYKRTDPYTHPMDKIFLTDITKELL